MTRTANQPTVHPIVRQLIPGDEPAVERFLSPRVERSMFLLSNLRRAGLAESDAPFCGTWAGAFEHDRLVAVAVHSNFGTIIPQAPVHLRPILRELLRLTTRPIKGVLATEDQAAPIIDSLAFPVEGPAVQSHGRHGLYSLSLDQLRLPPGLTQARITVRRAVAEDHPDLLRMRVGFLIEELGYRDAAEAERKAATDIAWIMPHCWAVENPSPDPDARPALVAMTGFNAAVDSAVQVGAVYTDPAHRSRGYARSAVAASLLDARDRGVQLAILFTPDINHAAQRAYASLGFNRIDDYRMLLLREPIAPDILSRRLDGSAQSATPHPAPTSTGSSPVGVRT